MHTWSPIKTIRKSNNVENWRQLRHCKKCETVEIVANMFEADTSYRLKSGKLVEVEPVCVG